MQLHPLLSRLEQRKTTPEQIAVRIVRRPELVEDVIRGLDAEPARVCYGALKALRLVSEKKPILLYPRMGHFVSLLGSENNILRWGAIIIIGNLASVDTEDRIDKILTRYLKPISGEVLITAANTIGGAAKIAAAKPLLANRIARAILKVEHANYQTEECRNVATGQAIDAFEQFFDHVKQKRPVLSFVERQTENPRQATSRKAARFLKCHQASLP